MYFIIWLIGLCAIAAHAEDSTIDDGVKLKARADFQSYAAFLHIRRDHPLNLDNEFLQIPKQQQVFFILPDLKLSSPTFSLIYRPELKVQIDTTELADSTKSSTITGARSREFFGVLPATDFLTLTHGIQFFTWGPAEAMSPSNKMFPELIMKKNSFTATSSKYLSRINYSIGKNFSLIGIVEIGPSPEKSADNQNPMQKFEPSGLAKAEWSWTGGKNYFGLVGGAQEMSNTWVGEYASVEIFNDVNLFFDISHERNSKILYPHQKNNGSGIADTFFFEQDRADDARLVTTSLFGAKYDFRNGSEIRSEIIYYGLGYSQSQLELAYDAIQTQSPLDELNRGALRQNTLLFLGQKYAYFSLRCQEFMNVKDWNFYLKHLRSLTDHSSFNAISFDYSWTDFLTLNIMYQANLGSMRSELGYYYTDTTIAGLKWSW